jgi:hypothetical protein
LSERKLKDDISRTAKKKMDPGSQCTIVVYDDNNKNTEDTRGNNKEERPRMQRIPMAYY